MSRADSDAEQQRKRVRLTARARHPMAWLRSRAARRRGLGDAARPVPTSADDVLERLADMKISTWTYGFDHRSVRHLGPMAQDFAEAFGLGSSDRRIDAVDANGVCMACIQALYRRVLALEAEVEHLRADSGEQVFEEDGRASAEDITP